MPPTKAIFNTVETTDTSANSLVVGGGLTATKGAFAGGLAISGGTLSDAGVVIPTAVPATTTMALYNNSGTLTWNGIALATGASLSGTTGAVAKFTASNAVGDSIMTESGAVITVTSTLNATAALQIGGASINTAGTLANVAYLNAANNFTNASGQTFAGGIGLSGGSPSTHGINIPSATPGILTTNLHNAGGLLIWTGGATFPGNVTVTTMNTYTFDQSVASGAAPTLTGSNFSGVPIASGISGLGTGVATALAVNIGSAGAPVLFDGAGGTPSSMVGTNITGIPDGALSANVALLNAANVFTASDPITMTPTTGTNAAYATLTNTGGSSYFGINSSTASGFFTNGTAYALFLRSASGQDIEFGTGTTKNMTLSSAGLLTVTAAGTNGVQIGALNSYPTYGILTFNGVTTFTGLAGMFGGPDANLNFNVPTGGKFSFAVQGAELMSLSSAGLLTVSGNGTHNFGTAGTSPVNDVIKINGSSAANSGPFYQLAKNGTTFALIGARSAIFGGGSTSNNLSIYSDSGVHLHAAGSADITFDSRGTLALTLGASQAATFTGAVTMSNYGAGTATFDASGNITSVSDERYKDRIAPLGYGLAEVLALSPVQHGYNDLSKLDRESLYGGFLAQDVQQVMPLAVNANPDGYLSLSDRPILGGVVNAIKELSARMDAAGL